MLKDMIQDLVDNNNIGEHVLMETLYALVIEYTDAFMERSDDYDELLRRMDHIVKDG